MTHAWMNVPAPTEVYALWPTSRMSVEPRSLRAMLSLTLDRIDIAALCHVYLRVLSAGRVSLKFAEVAAYGVRKL